MIAKERSDKEKDEIYKEWRELINMGPSELQAWAKNPDRLKASINRQEAKKEHGGIHSGYDSLHRIKRRVSKKRSEWTADDYDNAAQENSFNSRMLGNSPGKPVPETKRSKWEISLRNWGHDPRKKGSPGYSKFQAWKKKHF
jgi:coenzyme F420-reducing hydrogenase alpha subunit